MSRDEKLLLILAGAFSVTPLLLLFYMPKSTWIALPIGIELAIYATVGVMFLLYVYYRKQIRFSMVFLWVLLGFTVLAIILFALASWTAA